MGVGVACVGRACMVLCAAACLGWPVGVQMVQVDAFCMFSPLYTCTTMLTYSSLHLPKLLKNFNNYHHQRAKKAINIYHYPLKIYNTYYYVWMKHRSPMIGVDVKLLSTLDISAAESIRRAQERRAMKKGEKKRSEQPSQVRSTHAHTHTCTHAHTHTH